MYYKLTISDFPTIAAAVASIPAGVTSLDLSWNDLYEKTGAKLAIAFAGINDRVTSLNLSNNGLHENTGAQLAIAFAGINDRVTSLGLSSNDLYKKTGAQLAIAFAGIPAGVTSLDLSSNDLHEKTSAELAEAFAGIPAGVNSLNLSGNNFNRLNAQDLRLMLEAIPAHVTSVNLRGNHLFENKTRDEIDAFLLELGEVRFTRELDLSHNGESEFSRIIAPLVQMSTSGVKGLHDDNLTMPSDLTAIMASFATNVSEEKAQPFIEKTSKAVGIRKETHRLLRLGTKLTLFDAPEPLKNAYGALNTQCGS